MISLDWAQDATARALTAEIVLTIRKTSYYLIWKIWFPERTFSLAKISVNLFSSATGCMWWFVQQPLGLSLNFFHLKLILISSDIMALLTQPCETQNWHHSWKNYKDLVLKDWLLCLPPTSAFLTDNFCRCWVGGGKANSFLNEWKLFDKKWGGVEELG